MNIFHFNLLFSAWRSRSVTMSLVFALAMQGIWVGAHLREFFRSLGMFWLQVWILPFIVVWVLAKHEPKILPSAGVRRWLSIGLIAGSLLFGGALLHLDTKPGKIEARAKMVKPTATNSFQRLGTKAGRL